MGAQSSKAENQGEAEVASPAKANGQENGHVKVNGGAAEVKEEAQVNGSTAAEGEQEAKEEEEGGDKG
ncbi:hypothetical protein QTP86_020389 [Hemibagrus guttatus]|nr:hypothetical protein QTP86_020389 [Hemibagrus guttatus]